MASGWLYLLVCACFWLFGLWLVVGLSVALRVLEFMLVGCLWCLEV